MMPNPRIGVCSWSLRPRDPRQLVGALEGLGIDIVRAPGTGNENSEQVMADGRDVSDEIKRPEVDRQVSIVSRYRGVREAMVAQQRALAAGEGVVMVGRDIGTVVLPDAALKVYLTASPDERARRRYQELRGLGASVEQTSILSDLVKRDKIDSERKESPLRPAPDSRLIDTTHLTLEQVVDRVLELWGAASV
ncbi:MAG: (d)CMP kinase [Chloroflexi bacterium]|nr:(d)CMP kinase [Chloroflexota bacterium]